MECIHHEIKHEDEEEYGFCPIYAATTNYKYGINEALRNYDKERKKSWTRPMHARFQCIAKLSTRRQSISSRKAE